MKAFIERYWVTLLGAAFILASFFTSLDMAANRGLMPPPARVGLGLAAGVSIGYLAFWLYKKQKQTLAEIAAGVASCVFFLTIAYASFSEHIMWSPNILMIAMMCIGALLLWIGYQFQMRILVLISLLGGLLTPLLLRATPDQDIVLFLYVLVLNVVAIVLSVLRNWTELRVVSFFTTLAIYISYYFLFDPESWNKPFFYVSALYVVYMVGLLLASRHEENQYHGLNFYIGMLNAINYVFWSVYIFSTFELSYAFPTLVVSISFLAGAWVIYRANPKDLLPALAYFLLGLVVLAIAGEDFSQIFTSKGIPYVINCTLWLSIALLVYFLGKLTELRFIKYTGIGLWLLIIGYWYSVAWEVEWLPWFGLRYIPFINPGALLWIGIALSGFYLSRNAREFEDLQGRMRDDFSVALALVAHLVVGGLLTIQIQNLWEAYSIAALNSGMVVTSSWFLYALGIFLWGKYTKGKIFLWFGAAVLATSSIKMWFMDLPGEANIYKVIFLFFSGLVILLIGYVHRKWMDTEAVPALDQDVNPKNY